jgi:NAD(P)-dependent dehydrogenase (short-subunit alcohol dehydrogenase family)
MNLDLEGRCVLITGGSKGIGLACARVFMAEGARVAIVSRSQLNLDKARTALGKVHTHAADLANPAAAAAMVEQVEADFGPIDILVNSAGAARRTNAEELSPEAWRAAMDAKYFTYINVIDPLIKRMAARGRGVIVNVIGSGGRVASPTHLAGGAANAALMLATAGLANAYASKSVRVVGLNPGITNTERVAEGLKADAKRLGVSEEEALKRAIQKAPLGKLAEPEEIADIVAFAASERGRYLTGANISIDGAATPTVV